MLSDKRGPKLALTVWMHIALKPATEPMLKYPTTAADAITSPTIKFFARYRVVAAILAMWLLCAAIYGFRLNQVVGIVGDDAWYVLLAKSLATGQGFRLLNSPVPGLLPSYPPAFPFLLSLLLRFLPAGMEHLWLLKLTSVIAMFGVGLGTFVYTARLRSLPNLLAVLAAVAVVLLPAFVFLATSTLMSECVFTLAQLLTVLTAEKALRRSQSKAMWLWWGGVALLASWTFLTRSIAVSLLGAVVLYLLKERSYRAAAIFTVCTMLLIGPWLLYTRLNASTPEAKRAHGGNIVYTYGDQLWMKRAGANDSGAETIRDLPARIGHNFHNIITRDFCGMLFPSFLRTTQESGEETFSLGESDALGGGGMRGVAATRIVSLSLFLLILLGFVVIAARRITLVEILLPCSLAVIVIWPWWTFRFVLPLAPFLLHYLLVGLATLAHGAQKLLGFTVGGSVWTIPRMFMLSVIALYSYDHLGYIHSQSQKTDSSAWVSEYHESRKLLEWADTHLPPEAVIAANNPAYVFLHTGHRAISCESPLENREIWQRLGVRYFVILESHGMTELDGQERDFPVLYRSPNNMRIIDLGLPANRTESKH
ncbi:MAG TPA: hypothetical protein VFZ34_29265 [Blastocatellia bacterium]|nr:hypothetical protein [Blastocatellia bacterium]